MSDLRICPNDMFTIAHNGLNMFLTEYPHMDEKQRAKIHQLIEHFAKPDIRREKVQRPALLCRARQDGAILITPNFIQSDHIKNSP